MGLWNGILGDHGKCGIWRARRWGNLIWLQLPAVRSLDSAGEAPYPHIMRDRWLFIDSPFSGILIVERILMGQLSFFFQEVKKNVSYGRQLLGGLTQESPTQRVSQGGSPYRIAPFSRTRSSQM